MRDHEDQVDRRRPAHQQEARPGRVLRAGLSGRGGGRPFHDGRRGARQLARQPGRGGLRERRADPARSASSSTSSSARAVAAVELRDPTTSGHSERVAMLTVGLAERVDALAAGRFAELRFSRDQIAGAALRGAAPRLRQGRRARRRSSIKGKKLYATRDDRRPAALRLHREGARGRAPARKRLRGAGIRRAATEHLAALDAEYERRRDGDRAPAARRCCEANEPTVAGGGELPRAHEAADAHASDLDDDASVEDGPALPHRATRSRRSRSARAASPTQERQEIESHVDAHLRVPAADPVDRRVPPHPRDRLGAPREARRHGLPARAQGRRRSRSQSRMMTIADIYDALVAWDRPYKRAVPVERALDILPTRPRHGKLDEQLLALRRGEDLGARLQGRADASRAERHPLVIAHRGDSAHRPENTLASFAGALEVGRRPGRAGRPAHGRRRAGRTPRPAARPHHDRQRRRAPDDARRGARRLGGLPGRASATPGRASASRRSPRR